MTFEPVPLDHTFTAPIGVDIKGEVWTCVEMPGSAAFFGTKKSVRVDIEVDGLTLPSVGFMVTGTGGHMFSLNAKLLKQLGKGIGDTVTVRLLQRVK
jgi:hypothetical protein